MPRGYVEDFTGRRFGKLTVKERVPGKAPIQYLCLCDCGNTKEVQAQNLKSGRSTSCGCFRTSLLKERNDKTRLDVIGERSGSLICESYGGTNHNGQLKINCICDCGNFVTILATSFISGNTRSCGCIHKAIATSIILTANPNPLRENGKFKARSSK